MPISIDNLALNTLSAWSISQAAYSALTPLAMPEPSIVPGSRIQLEDHEDLPDLPLMPLPIVLPVQT